MSYLIFIIFTIFSCLNSTVFAESKNFTELGENWTKSILNNEENSNSFCEMVDYISAQQKNILSSNISPEEFISFSNTLYSFNLTNQDITNLLIASINFKNTSQGSIYSNLSAVDTIIKIISEDQPNLELLLNLSDITDVNKNILRFINSEKFKNTYNQKKLENQKNKEYWQMAFSYYFLIQKELTRLRNEKNIYDSLLSDKNQVLLPNIETKELCVYIVNSLTNSKKVLVLESFQGIENYKSWLNTNFNKNQSLQQQKNN